MPDVKWNINDWPQHTHQDVYKRNLNIDEEHELCKRCEGTGNELISMWRKCSHCKGTGRKEER